MVSEEGSPPSNRLPDSSSSTEISLSQPTENEVLRVLEANSKAWKGPLSLEAYIRREQRLDTVLQTARNGPSTQKLSKDIFWWILTSPTGLPNIRSILSSCKTVRKRALVAYDSTGSARGRVVKEVVCQGVSSVYCEERYRRRGYAGRMMSELSQKTKTWEADEDNECKFSVLFSDIGKNFYARYGWHPFPSSHISLVPLTSPIKDSILPHTTPIHDDMLDELCAIDEKLLRKRLVTESSSKITVALVPAATTFRWHHARECFLAEELLNRKVDVIGAMVGSEPGKRAWCLWQRTFYRKGSRSLESSASENTFHILRLVLEDGLSTTDAGTSRTGSGLTDQDSMGSSSTRIQAIAALLIAAQMEAAKWEQDSVELWNASPESVLAADLAVQAARQCQDVNGVTSIKPIHRETESVCSLLWHGGNSEPGLENSCWNDVEWACNEKYGWF